MRIGAIPAFCRGRSAHVVDADTVLLFSSSLACSNSSGLAAIDTQRPVKALLHPTSVVAFSFALATVFMSTHTTEAQTPPAVIFSVSKVKWGSSTAFDIEGPADSLSWSDSESCPGAFIFGSCAQIFSGSASGGVLALSSIAETSGTFPSGSNQSGSSPSYRVTIYTRHHPTVTVGVASSGSIDITGGGNGSVDFPRTSSDLALSYNHASGSTSGSHSASFFINQGCNGANSEGSTSFTGYPGVVYSIPNGMQDFTAGSYVQLWDSATASTFDLSAELSSTITVTLGASSPVALIDGPIVASVPKPTPDVGDSVKFNNTSYDPDNNNGTTALEGICARTWEVEKPDGTILTNTTSAGSYTFTPDMPGQYTVRLTVVDNEGDPSQTEDTFAVSPRPPGPGYCPVNTPTFCLDDDDICTSVSPGTGNPHYTHKGSSPTRGAPLNTTIHIDGQTNFPTRTTAMGNANFVYGMRVGSMTPSGGSAARWFLIDGDGSEHDYGAASGSPAAPA